MPGWQLNAKGRAQARWLAQQLSRLPIGRVYTSPLERARETAESIAAPLGLQAQISDDLGEIRFGAWEGSSFEDLEPQPEWRAYNSGRSWSRPPGGELMVEVQHRMVRRVDCLRKRHPNETVALVSHCDPLRALVCYCLGVSLDHITRFELDPGSVSVLEIMPWSVQVVSLNHSGEIR
jgi:probable phosphoglycerate mutase